MTVADPHQTPGGARRRILAAVGIPLIVIAFVIAAVRIFIGLATDDYVDDRSRRIAAEDAYIAELSKHFDVGGEDDRKQLILSGYLQCDNTADSLAALPHFEELAYRTALVSKAAKEHLCDVRVGR